MPLSSFVLAARYSWRPGDVALFVDEIKKLIIAVDGLRHYYFRLSLPGLRLLANVAVFIKKIQIFRVVALQPKLLHLFCHACLDSGTEKPDA